MFKTPCIRLLLSLAAFPLTALAAESFNCITDAEARSIVADFALIAAEHPGYVKVAKRLLTSDFISISDSVNIADGIPVSPSSKKERHEFLARDSSIQQ